MKTPISDQPRFICRVVRGWIALTGSEVERVDPNALPASAQRHASTGPNNALGSTRSTFSGSRHVAACPDCQQYFAACDRLESSLRRGAVHQLADVPEGLERRIMQAIDRSAPPPRATSRLFMISLAGVAAAVAVAAIFLSPKSVVVPGNVEPMAIAAHDPVATAPAAEGTLKERLLATVAPATALLQKDPLQEEVDSVYSDAQSAVRFLALNFLPNAPERVVRRTS